MKLSESERGGVRPVSYVLKVWNFSFRSFCLLD